jgi:hypothetical protein
VDEFASDTIWTDTLLVEGIAFSWFVVGVFVDLLDHLLGTVGELAFSTVATGLVLLPLPAHFGFVLRFINFWLIVLIICWIKTEAIKLIIFGWSIEYHHLLLIDRVLSFVTCGHAIGLVAYALFSVVIFSRSVPFGSLTLLLNLLLDTSIDIKRSALSFWDITRWLVKHFGWDCIGCC